MLLGGRGMRYRGPEQRESQCEPTGYGAGMIRLSVHYPKTDGATFDHDYYRDKHVPLATSTWGVPASIDKGIDGPYEASVHFTFDSLEAVAAAMALEGTGAILMDVANYTTITPVMQTSEIVS